MRLSAVSVCFLVLQTVWTLPLQQDKTATATPESDQLQYYSQTQHSPDFQELQAGVQYLDLQSRDQRSEETRVVEDDEVSEESNEEDIVDLVDTSKLPERQRSALLRKQSGFAHLSLGANLGPVGKIGLSAGLGGPGMTGLGLAAQLGQLGGGAAVGLTDSGLYLIAAAGQNDNYLDLAQYYKYNNYKSHLLRNSPPPPPPLCCLLYGRGQPPEYLLF